MNSSHPTTFLVPVAGVHFTEPVLARSRSQAQAAKLDGLARSKSWRTFLFTTLLLSALVHLPLTGLAQGAAFTYQGKLSDGGQPADGTNYGMVFLLYDAPASGILLGTQEIVSVTISNGLFTVPLSFGNAFDGNSRWLEITVQKNGGIFTTLSPRQPITSAPYAIMAHSASNLLGTLPVAQLNGIIPASQLPGAIVTNNATSLNLNGGFSGSFSGNGGGLTNVPGTLPWQIVSDTAPQAQPNAAYLLTNDSLVTITLPSSPSPGDVVRVSGSGLSGWKIAQNSNQFIASGNLAGNLGQSWLARGITASWLSVASSADGTKLVAGGNTTSLYTSTDAGVTWTPHGSGGNWDSIASSADGSKLVTASYGGQVQTSTDSGLTWTTHGIPTTWRSFASSADGTKLVGGTYNGPLYTSTDSGLTWTARMTDSNRLWYGAASSADGSRLVAGAGVGQIYTSTDSGVTWTPRESVRVWSGVASSADGMRLVAVDNGGGNPGGLIYTSTDAGATWTPRDSNRRWLTVASSADGMRLVAAVNGGQIYTSVDSGLTWTARMTDSNRSWMSVASNADGTKLVGVVGGQIYTSALISVPSTTIGAAGYLLGTQNSSIELQYLGNNQFIPISHEGVIQAY